jgi:hypothetical protein
MVNFRANFIGALGLIVALGTLSACKKETPVEPTPQAVLVTEVLTGVITPLGTVTHQMTVNYTHTATNASAIVTAMTTVANGTSQPVTIGMGFGTLAAGVCTRVAALTNAVSPFNTKLFVPPGTFNAGTFCFQVFDNPDAPTVIEPLNYSITLEHF